MKKNTVGLERGANLVSILDCLFLYELVNYYCLQMWKGFVLAEIISCLFIT